MNVRRLWIRIAAGWVLLAGATLARGEETTPPATVPSTVPLPVTTPATDPATPPATTTIPEAPIESFDKPSEAAAPLESQSAPQTPAPAKPQDSVVPAAPPKPQDPFAEMIDRAIAETAKRKLTAGMHTPWQVVHGILAQRWELTLVRPVERDEISGIEWIMSGVYHENQPLWEATPYGGRGHPFTKPYAFEGHPTQFMGYMTMADIPLEYEVQTPTKVITVGDIINDAKMQVNQGVEITWTLWALSHYEEPDAQWFNAAGEPWSIERLMKLQIDEQVTKGACGGCHGLFALAYARNMYLSTGRPLRGVWFEADQKIKRYIEEARALQNRDGSFSTNHFKGPGYSDDFATRIVSSGHQLEWLMIALPQSRLKEDWVRQGIASVANGLIDNRHKPSDCGPLFHGMNALVIYRQRTVPEYLVPRFNSQIKLADRAVKSSAAPEAAKAPPSEARRETSELTAPEPTVNPPEPSRKSDRFIRWAAKLLDDRS